MVQTRLQSWCETPVDHMAIRDECLVRSPQSRCDVIVEVAALSERVAAAPVKELRGRPAAARTASTGSWDRDPVRRARPSTSITRSYAGDGPCLTSVSVR